MEASGSTSTPDANRAEHSALPDHPGKRSREEFELFVPAPPQIGELISGESTLLIGQAPKPLKIRLILSVLLAASILIGGLYLASKIERRRLRETMQTLVVLSATGAMTGYLIRTRFRARCTYVGRDGIARYVTRGSRQRPPREEMLLFAKAAELRTLLTRELWNGRYTGTRYAYTWHDARGDAVYALRGVHRGNMKRPKPLPHRR